MTDVASSVAAELPRVNAFIAEQVEGLHPVVRPIAAHALLAGGKRLRPMLALWAARALRLPAGRDPLPLACSLEFLHTATLLHDDILDGADLRRGRESAHKAYGVTPAILAGDMLLALANRLVAGYGLPDLTWVLSDAILRTAAGEVLEIAAARDVSLTRERYLEIITGKTAYLFQGACECGAILAGAAPALRQAARDYGLGLGVAFQLVDDALDYVSPAGVTGKPSGGDLREGKLTLPLLLYLETLPAPERAGLTAGLAAGTLPEADISRHLAAIAAGGFAQATRQAAAAHADAARAALSAFPASPERDLLAAVLDFVLSRGK